MNLVSRCKFFKYSIRLRLIDKNTLSTQAILLRANDYKSKSTQTTLIRPNENKLNRLNRIIFGSRIFDEPKDIERVLKEVLLDFQTSKDVRRQSTEMGVQIMKYRTAIRQFVKEVRDGKLEKCNRIALQSALNEENANSGVYCGPLRLLAHEVFDRFNNKGVPCNLVTGEERRELKGIHVPLTSSTIEMVNLQKQVDVAVIDEIQMISDQQRGWAWTQALLGLQAKEIHICGEPSAVPLVRSICQSINEDIEVREYKRLSTLEISPKSLDGDLKKIKKGDCVVTFSRKSIFSLKHEIEAATGLRCAVAYGSLPPETRSQQAKLFNDPNSGFDVLVASDAVGMVFESIKKYDGIGIRHIPIPQIKQIAGRAGRFGTENSVGESMDLKYIHQAMEAPHKDLEMAGLQPTMEMVELFAHQLPDVKEFAVLLGSPCNISKIVTLPETVPHNDDMLGELESVHHLAREMKLKCETIIHDALQKLKTPRRRPRITTRDVRELKMITKNNNKHLDKKPKITSYGKNGAVNTVKKPVPHKQIENL
ncbi:3082_t:CDS:2 [Racocetra fulgida]|uniref:RNA helicase n=1 Tax=Racocetra fulgida TaxID=60492 RepID=A0A9N9GUA2_9GLOM|nr:3082_t:CDS:2 [Racocetra fulgida]